MKIKIIAIILYNIYRPLASELRNFLDFITKNLKFGHFAPFQIDIFMV